MKKIAFLLFMVFAAVQLAPSVMAAFSDTTSIFVADEEKSGEKGYNDDNKAKKDYAIFTSQSCQLDNQIKTAFHAAEKIYTSPCLEMIAPPPNFC
jgi:hypothetical protein